MWGQSKKIPCRTNDSYSYPVVWMKLKPAILVTPTISFRVHQSGSTVSIKATQQQSHNAFSIGRRNASRSSFLMMFSDCADIYLAFFHYEFRGSRFDAAVNWEE
ncbi:hypothetical protein TNCV_2662941 [Trichonephila clavipes]|nr:hypothetical protein TNCV_2662941 [Trichonephila clavipes]